MNNDTPHATTTIHTTPPPERVNMHVSNEMRAALHANVYIMVNLICMHTTRLASLHHEIRDSLY